jgi:hypothetical protein
MSSDYPLKWETYDTEKTAIEIFEVLKRNNTPLVMVDEVFAFAHAVIKDCVIVSEESVNVPKTGTQNLLLP